MAVTYPLPPPTGLIVPNNVKLRMMAKTASFESPYTGYSNLQPQPYQKWGGEVSFAEMKREDASKWIAYLLTLNGMEGEFLMGISSAQNPLGSVDADALVNSVASDGRSITIKGFIPDTANVLKRGDYFSINNRLYMALLDVDSDSSGISGDINIRPHARSDLAIDNIVKFGADAVGLWQLATDNVEWNINKAARYNNFSFSMVESLRDGT